MVDQINQIIRGLYITNYESAIDSNKLLRYNIKTVINCTNKNDKTTLNINYLQIPIDDPPSTKDINFINRNFMQIVDYIDAAIMRDENVLVHCVMGSQRSATIVAVYLMAKFRVGYMDAITYIKSKRSICFFGDVNYIDSLTYVGQQIR